MHMLRMYGLHFFVRTKADGTGFDMYFCTPVPDKAVFGKGPDDAG